MRDLSLILGLFAMVVGFGIAIYSIFKMWWND